MRINFQETIGLAMESVWAHKFRSGLTILGIVIGITTVVTVASLLTGLQSGIVELFKGFGPDNIFVAKVSGDPSGANARPKELKRKPIRAEYAETIQRMSPAVEQVAISLFINPPAGKVFTIKVPGFESDRLGLVASSANDFETSPRELQAGRVFTNEEAQRAQRVAVIGPLLAEALFPGESAVNRNVTIDGGEYTVVGVFAPATGSFFGENGQDRQVTIPLETGRLHYPQLENFFLKVKARAGQREDALEQTRDALRKIRRTPAGAEDDFALSTADSIIASFKQITGMIVLVSVAISGLGLLVGGIGVMNIMLVSVTERTREIGVRKAIGARRIDIVLQFLAEAVALTGAGGVIGVVFSMLVTLVVSLVMPFLRAGVPLWAVVTGFSVSVGVGVFFGVWPAMKASRLDPVEALRYE